MRALTPMCELGVSGSGVGESGSVGRVNCRVSSRAGPRAGPLGGLSKNDKVSKIIGRYAPQSEQRAQSEQEPAAG